MEFNTRGQKCIQDDYLQRFPNDLKSVLLSIIRIHQLEKICQFYLIQMILCDSPYSNNNKKITFTFTKNVKNGVVMKLLTFVARYRRSKIRIFE